MTKRYSELIQLPSYDERLRYLRCFSKPWTEVFGPNRYFNQSFYKSIEWKRVRREVILRDNGCDLGIRELPIRGRILIHHLTPITLDDILEGREILFDLENLICCSHDTHSAIHFETAEKRPEWHERTKNDMCPWKEVSDGTINLE